jgi:hypothetical protein
MRHFSLHSVYIWKQGEAMLDPELLPKQWNRRASVDYWPPFFLPLNVPVVVKGQGYYQQESVEVHTRKISLASHVPQICVLPDDGPPYYVDRPAMIPAGEWMSLPDENRTDEVFVLCRDGSGYLYSASDTPGWEKNPNAIAWIYQKDRETLLFGQTLSLAETK